MQGFIMRAIFTSGLLYTMILIKWTNWGKKGGNGKSLLLQEIHQLEWLRLWVIDRKVRVQASPVL